MKRLKPILLAFLLAACSRALPAQRVVGSDGSDKVRLEFNFMVPNAATRYSARLPQMSEYRARKNYDRWWHEIAACEGLPLPRGYRRVRFFQVNAIHFFNRDHPTFVRDLHTGELLVQWAIAQSYLVIGVVFVALPYRDDELAIKHELLHLLLYAAHIPAGDDGHPLPYFQRCGMTRVYLNTPSAKLTAIPRA